MRLHRNAIGLAHLIVLPLALCATAEAQFSNERVRREFRSELKRMMEEERSFSAWTTTQKDRYGEEMVAMVDGQSRAFDEAEARALLGHLRDTGVLSGTNIDSLKQIHFEMHVEKIRNRFADYVALMDATAEHHDAIARQNARLVELARSGLEAKAPFVPESLREDTLVKFLHLLERDAGTAFRPYGNTVLEEEAWMELELQFWRAIMNAGGRDSSVREAWERVRAAGADEEEKQRAERWLQMLLSGYTNPAFFVVRTHSRPPPSDRMLAIREALEELRREASEQAEREEMESIAKWFESWREQVRKMEAAEDKMYGPAPGIGDGRGPDGSASEAGSRSRGGGAAAEAIDESTGSGSRLWVFLLVLSLALAVLLLGARRRILGEARAR